jgi:ribonuclease BN (tRNA processing enzyme)
VHEAQYTDEQLRDHRGWGHSSYGQAIEVARRAGVRFLAITHHDPDNDDAFLRAREAECQALFPECVLAREGMEIIL